MSQLLCARLLSTLQKLKSYINQNLEAYSENGVSKQERSSIVSTILQTVRQTAPEGGFAKFNVETDQWEEVGDAFAREKISQMLRDALSYKYPSSSKAKRRRNKSRRASATTNTTSSSSSNSSTRKPQQHDHTILHHGKPMSSQDRGSAIAELHSKTHEHLPGFAFLRRDDPMVSISSRYPSTSMGISPSFASYNANARGLAPDRNVSLLETRNETTPMNNNQPASAPLGIDSSFAFPGHIAGSSSSGDLLPTRSVSLETGSAARQAANMMAAKPPARSNSVGSSRLPTGNDKFTNHDNNLHHINYNYNHNHNNHNNHNRSNPIFQWHRPSNNSNEPEALERINIEPLPMEESIFQFWIDDMNNNKRH